MSPEERAEQRNDEILALECVYENELVVSHEADYPQLEIYISAFAKSNSDVVCKVTLNCIYDDNYPMGPLNAAIKYTAETCKLNDRHKDKLMQVLKQEIENGTGSPVIYNVVSALQESLQYIADNISKEDDIEALERKIREEEENKRKFIGTPVTRESFMIWKKNFDQELENLKSRDSNDLNTIKKLTGKELFLQDHRLNDSDLIFMKDEDEEMEIDESLFDINDLDLEDLSDD